MNDSQRWVAHYTRVSKPTVSLPFACFEDLLGPQAAAAFLAEVTELVKLQVGSSGIGFRPAEPAEQGLLFLPFNSGFIHISLALLSYSLPSRQLEGPRYWLHVDLSQYEVEKGGLAMSSVTVAEGNELVTKAALRAIADAAAKDRLFLEDFLARAKAEGLEVAGPEEAQAPLRPLAEMALEAAFPGAWTFPLAIAYDPQRLESNGIPLFLVASLYDMGEFALVGPQGLIKGFKRRSRFSAFEKVEAEAIPNEKSPFYPHYWWVRIKVAKPKQASARLGEVLAGLGKYEFGPRFMQAGQEWADGLGYRLERFGQE